MPGSRPKSSASDAEQSTDAVLVASRALVGIAARSLAAVEDTVTLAQYRALVLLASRGEMKVGALAESLELHQSTATRLCDRLVAKELVERKHSAESRREVFVTLAPSGEKLVRAVSVRRRAEIAKIVKRMPAPQRDRLVASFSAFAEAAEELPDEAWKLGWTS